MKMKIVTVVGARPQFIKASAVSKVFLEYNNICEVVIHTGQHYDSSMSSIFFDELKIPKPAYNLEVKNKNHGAMTGSMMIKLEEIVINESPDLLLVYGDTNSTLAGALTASKLHIPVAHVEAGLRSFNKKMAEEVNRVVTDHVSEFLFAPTSTSVLNLQNEGINRNVFLVGDVMLDATLMFSEIAHKNSFIVDKLALKKNNYILVTIHRAENTDNYDRMKVIVSSLQEIADKITVILPLHPRTVKMIERWNLLNSLQKIRVIQPVGFLDMVKLEQNASQIITDSGGVQKEAYFHRVPCVTLRDETEWIETVEAGWNSLVCPLTRENFIHAVRSGKKSDQIVDYGDGRASYRIVDILIHQLLENNSAGNKPKLCNDSLAKFK